jgi:hypothetical protein
LRNASAPAATNAEEEGQQKRAGQPRFLYHTSDASLPGSESTPALTQNIGL